ncbi:MAG: hypothetical protein JW915_14470 [Chitinispirillaceae bacterium]|nr:hypothetical protein [Chitinispirillaceae bacterium]
MRNICSVGDNPPPLPKIGHSDRESRVPTSVATYYYPIDNHDAQFFGRTLLNNFLGNKLSRLREYHVIFIPSLGQFSYESGIYTKKIGDTTLSFFCGRTCGSMLYNYRTLIQGGDPLKEYIRHSTGDNSDWCMDLRFPNGDLAFCSNGSKEKHYYRAAGAGHRCQTLGTDNGNLHGKGNDYKGTTLFGKSSCQLTKQRFDDAQKIRAKLENDPHTAEEEFATILLSLRNNNPVLLYSGFSTSNFRGHKVIISGYLYIDGHLWFHITNPSPYKGLVGTVFSASPANATNKEQDINLDKYNFIPLERGDWNWARASYHLVRASYLLASNPQKDKLVTIKRGIQRFQIKAEYQLVLDDLASLETQDTATLQENLTDGVVSADKLTVNSVGGFCYYSHKRLEVLPEILFSNIGEQTSFPILIGKDIQPGPARYYHANEFKNDSGFFPVGINRNVHGGIHVAPFEKSNEPTPVHAVADGYIIAARLPGHNNKVNNKHSAAFMKAEPGFVLIRHEIKNKNNKNAAPIPLYSLYMHLVSPDWDGISANPYRVVPWFNRLRLERFGAVACLNPDDKEKFCKFYRASEKFDPTSLPASLKIFLSPQDMKETTMTTRINGKVVAYGKKAPQMCEKALAALENGNIVTFNKGLLPVSRKEVLGFIESSGSSIHWELFSTQVEHGISDLLDLDSNIKSLFITIEEKGEHANFFEPDEFLAFVKNAFGNDKKSEKITAFKNKLEVLLQSPDYHKKLVEALSDPVTFVKESAVKTPSSSANSEPAEPADSTKNEEPVIPVTVLIENPFNQISSSETALKLTAEYYDVTDTKETLIGKEDVGILSSQKFTVTLLVPASTDRIRFKSENFVMSEISMENQEIMTNLFSNLVPSRLRNVHLKSKSEWTKDGLSSLIDALWMDERIKKTLIRMFPEKLTKATDFPKDLKDDLMQVCWWDRIKTEEDPFGEMYIKSDSAATQNETSIFSSLLPGNGMVESLHPVTLLWLLKIYNKRNWIEFSSFHESRTDSATAPVFWNLLYKDTFSYGSQITAVVISDSFKNGEPAEPLQVALLNNKINLSIPLVKRVSYKDGLWYIQFPAYIWGPWKICLTTFPDAESNQGTTLSNPSGTGYETPDIPKPLPSSDALSLSTASGNGDFTFLLAFSKNCPDLLSGFVQFSYALDNGSNDIKKLSLKQHDTLLPFMGKKISAYINNRTEAVSVFTKGCGFSSKEFFPDKKTVKLNRNLANAVIRIRKEILDESIRTILPATRFPIKGLTPVSISADGNEIELSFYYGKKIVQNAEFIDDDIVLAQKVVNSFKDSLGIEQCTKSNNNIKLSATASPDEQIQVSISGSSITAEIVKSSNMSLDQKMLIFPNFLIPNGGYSILGPDYNSTNSYSSVRSIIEKDFIHIKASGWKHCLASLQRPGFEPKFNYSVYNIGKKYYLRITAKKRNPDTWGNEGGKIECPGITLYKSKHKDPSNISYLMQLTNNSKLGTEVTLTASGVSHNTAVLPFSETIFLKPQITSFTITPLFSLLREGFPLLLSAQTHLFPQGKSLSIKCIDETGNPAMSASKPGKTIDGLIEYRTVAVTNRKEFTIDNNGVVEAALFSSHLDKSKTYIFQLFRPYDPVYGIASAKLTPFELRCTGSELLNIEDGATDIWEPGSMQFKGILK